MKKNKLIASAIAAIMMLALTGCDLTIRDGNKISVLNASAIDTEKDITKFPFAVEASESDGLIGPDSSIGPFKNLKDFDKDSGISISFAVKGLGSDWTMLFQLPSGNIGLTCLHSCSNKEWKANLWPTGYPTENSPAQAYDVYLNSKDFIYVTISMHGDEIVFYKDGERMFGYSDSVEGCHGGDPAFPTIENYVTSLINDIAEYGFYCIHPSDSWALGTGGNYLMKNLSFHFAVSDDEAEKMYNSWKK